MRPVDSPYAGKAIMRQTSILIFVILLCQGCGWNPLAGKEEYLKRGREFAAQGKYDDALLQYRKAIQKDDKYGEAYLRLGQVLAAQDKPLEAFAVLTKTTELIPESLEARTELGRTALRILLANPRRPQNVYDAIQKSSAALLAKDPKSVEGLRLRGYLQVADSKTDEAVATFRQSLTIQPDQPEITAMLVQTLLAGGQLAEAERVALSGIEKHKSYGPLYDTLYGFYMNEKRVADAERVLKQKVAANPGNSFFVTQLADHYWSQKAPQMAESVLQPLLSDAKSYPTGARDAGDFYRRNGKLSEAEAQFKRGSEADAALRYEYLQRLVVVYLEQGKTQEAGQLLETMLKERPDDPEALGARASLRMASGKPEEIRKAISDFAALAARKPLSSEIRLNLARAYRANGQGNEARSTLQDVLRREPQNRIALRELADLALRSQQAGDALQYSERLLALDPSNLGARLNRTAALALLGRSSEVRADLRLITADHPESKEAWMQLAILNLQEGNFGEAEATLRRIYKPGDTDVRPLAALVRLQIARGQGQNALALVKEESQRQPQSVDLRNLLAGTAAAIGDYDQALAVLTRLAADFPQNSDYLVRIAQISMRKGHSDQAVENLKKAVSITPEDPLALAQLSQALARDGKYQEAVEAARQGVKLRPEDPVLINNLAWNLALAGTNLDEAASLAQKAVTAAPRVSDYTDTLGMVYLKAKKTDEALQLFQALARKSAENAVYRYHLAMALHEKGRPREAKAELDAALRLNPPATDAAEIRKFQQSISASR